MDEPGYIAPWDIGALVEILSDPKGQRITRAEFIHAYSSYDFLYGRGAASEDAKQQGFRTLTSGIHCAADDPCSVFVFPIPPNDQLVITGAFKDRVGVGRCLDPNVQIVIPDPSVSKLHAYLKRGSGGLLVFDASSTNGTRINDKLIRDSQVLKEGDKVQFGKANLIFEYLLASACYDAARQDILKRNEKSDP